MSKLPLDSNYDLEQQFILRMTDLAAAESLAADIDAGVSFKENFTLEFKPDMRHALVRYNGQVYQGRLMDLPCMIESLKTTDKRSFYKTADICQMMICTQGEEAGPLRGTAAYLDDRARSWSNTFDPSRESREFQFLHGLTPPLKNVLRRRFRKSRRKRLVDMPKIEKEVKQLLRADLQAVGVKWEVIWSDPQSSSSNMTSMGPGDGGVDASTSATGLRRSHQITDQASVNRPQTADDEEEDEDGSRPFPIDRRDVFGDISSSSSGGGDGGDSSSMADSSDSSGPSDDERRTAAPAARAPKTAERSVTRRDALTSEPSLSTSATHQFNEAIGLTTLKNELAAELLLSDSGDESENLKAAASHDGDSEAEEEQQHATAAAHLVAHEESHPVLDDDGDVDDVGAMDVDDLNDVEDDDDEVMHRGGELLDEETLIDLDGAVSLTDAPDIIGSSPADQLQ